MSGPASLLFLIAAFAVDVEAKAAAMTHTIAKMRMVVTSPDCWNATKLRSAYVTSILRPA